MYPREPKHTPEIKPNKSSEATPNNRVAEAKKKLEAVGQSNGTEPQQRVPRPLPPLPPSNTTAKKENPYGYFQPPSVKPQSPATTSVERGGKTLRIPCEADLRDDNNTVQRESKRTVSTEPQLDTSRLSGPYGNPKLRVKEVGVEAPAIEGPNIRVKREVGKNEHVATGKFIVASNHGYIQKDDKTDQLIHYDADSLTDAQKDVVAKSMGANFRKPLEGGKTYALSVSTKNERLVIKPPHH